MIGSLRGGFDSFTKALEKEILLRRGEIKLQNNVTDPDHYRSQHQNVIVTSPGIIPDEIKYMAHISLVLEVERLTTPFYWINIADENLPFGIVIEHNNAFRPTQHKIIYIAKYLDENDPFWGKSDEEIFKAFTEGYAQVSREFNVSLVKRYFVFRSRYSQPVFSVGTSTLPYKIQENSFLAYAPQLYPYERGIEQSLGLATDFVKKCLPDFLI